MQAITNYYTSIIFTILCVGSLADILDMTILHTNDIHSRFVPFDSKMRPCEEGTQKQCFGGAARRLTAIKKIRQRHKNVLLLDGGDQFQGTLWYTVLKWKPISEVVNLMNYTALSFGNHEFDDSLLKKDEKLGEIGLAPYLKAVKSPFVSSNIQADGSEIDGLFKVYHDIEVENRKVAIIGYVTPETGYISDPGPKIVFRDEVESLKELVANLKNRNFNIIIAIGHAGYSVDKKICAQVPGVDIVVGGHTNTFLYSGNSSTLKETPEGPYPTVVDNVDGNPCLVVQDYAFGKYLGFLQVKFDEQGKLTHWSGNPITIDYIPEDAEVKSILKPYEGPINEFQRTVIGKTAVALDGHRMRCRLKECNFGNLVADSLVFSYLKRQWLHSNMPDAKFTDHWTPSAVALVNSAVFKDFEIDAWSNLTMADMYNTFPFANTVELLQLNGSIILQALEKSVESLEDTYDDPAGKFLQVSGLKVDYDLRRKNGDRVRRVQVRCARCPMPTFAPLDTHRAYNVVTISFLKKGGDGYSMLKEYSWADGLETLDIDVVSDYIKTRSPIAVGLEGRIRFLDQLNGSDSCVSAAVPPTVPGRGLLFYVNLMMLLIVIFCRL